MKHSSGADAIRDAHGQLGGRGEFDDSFALRLPDARHLGVQHHSLPEATRIVDRQKGNERRREMEILRILWLPVAATQGVYLIFRHR